MSGPAGEESPSATYEIRLGVAGLELHAVTAEQSMVVSAAMLSRAARAQAARATFTPPSRAAAYSPVVRWSAARPGTSNWLTDPDGSGHGGEIGRAMAASGGIDRQVCGHAARACLGRRRLAEYGRAAPAHVGAVGHHDHVVDDRHEDDEVDDRGDECAKVNALAVERPPQALAGGAAAGRGVDQRRDDVVRERLDQRAERQRDHQAHGNDDQIALHQEVLEASQHPALPLLLPRSTPALLVFPLHRHSCAFAYSAGRGDWTEREPNRPTPAEPGNGGRESCGLPGPASGPAAGPAAGPPASQSRGRSRGRSSRQSVPRPVLPPVSPAAGPPAGGGEAAELPSPAK